MNMLCQMLLLVVLVGEMLMTELMSYQMIQPQKILNS